MAKGFDFLGQNVRKYNGKLLAKKSIKTLLDKVREIIKEGASTTQIRLIQKLNPIINGWAKRRHPSRAACWIKQKYFRQEKKRNWTFPAQENSKRKPSRIQPFYIATVPIVRHIKIRNLANPFDPQWEDYFKMGVVIGLAYAKPITTPTLVTMFPSLC